VNWLRGSDLGLSGSGAGLTLTLHLPFSALSSAHASLTRLQQMRVRGTGASYRSLDLALMATAVRQEGEFRTKTYRSLVSPAQVFLFPSTFTASNLRLVRPKSSCLLAVGQVAGVVWSLQSTVICQSSTGGSALELGHRFHELSTGSSFSDWCPFRLARQ